MVDTDTQVIAGALAPVGIRIVSAYRQVLLTVLKFLLALQGGNAQGLTVRLLALCLLELCQLRKGAQPAGLSLRRFLFTDIGLLAGLVFSGFPLTRQLVAPGDQAFVLLFGS